MANLTVKKSIIDLYVAYFNRVPDYEGYQYWIEQYDLGSSLTDISNEFYKAGATQFSAETGYSIGMSKEAFIRQLYDGILDRGPSSSLAPNATEVAYWVNKLDGLNGDKGALVLQMIKEIRDFDATNNAAIKEVQDKFNNKMYASFLLLEDPAGAEDIYGAYDFGETAYAGGPALTPEEKIALGKQVLTTITADVASIDETITKFVATLKAPVVEPPPPPVETPDTEKTVGLSVYTDVVTANQFNAGLEYTPGGDDRVNTLQSEDKLTGVGINPTLVAELGNANDNGSNSITPQVSGVETFKFSFTGNDINGRAVTMIDMQDAKTDGGIDTIEISRISNGPGVAVISNINGSSANPESPDVIDLGIQNTRADASAAFLFRDQFLNGTAGDTANVRLNETNLNSLTIETMDGARNTAVNPNTVIGGSAANNGDALNGFETINMQSGSANGGVNSIDALWAEDLQTLNIVHNTGTDGDSNLTIGNGARVSNTATTAITGIAEQGSLRTINGENFQANLDLTIVPGTFSANLDGTSTDVAFTLNTGIGDDVVRIFGSAADAANINDLTKGVIGTNDVIAMGAGTDTLALSSATDANFLADATAPNSSTPPAAPVPANNQVDTPQVSGADIVTVTRLANNVADAATLIVDMNQIQGEQQVVLRNAGDFIDNNNDGIFNAGDVADGIATFRLNDVSKAEAAAIAIKHSTTGNNSVAQTVIDVATVLEGQVDTVGIDIQGASNADPRFNFTLNTTAVSPVVTVPASNPVVYEKAIKNLTITDSDSEDNTVQLNNFADYTGTVTITGGNPGHFLNLDWSENALRKDVTGGNTDGKGIANTVGSNTGALVAAVVDASTYADDVIVRLGGGTGDTATRITTTQSVTMGSGNDFVIMDTLNDSHAGLTVSDTIKGGAGNDVLAFGGNTQVNIGQSEWLNVSGFETIRLLGNNVANVPANPGAPGAYNLVLTNQLVADNGATDASGNKRITIINDNDPQNDLSINDPKFVAATPGTGAESSAVIDATTLAANQFFTYYGEEGASCTTDRFILGDVQVNGGNIIDGGAVDTDSTTFAGNADILEIRGAAVVTASAGDLSGMSNIGNIEITNNNTLPITTTLELNNKAVDALVDSFHTASSTQVENLNVSTQNEGGANISLRLDAAGLSNAFGLNVNTTETAGNDTITTGAGNDTITTNVGNDSIISGTGNDTIDAGAGNDTVFGQGGNDSILGGDGNDQIVADGDADNGNDTVLGGAGLDTIFGGKGNDSLDGGADNDIVSGGDGDDTVLGGDGNDVLGGGLGNDSLDGGDGNDTLVAEGGTDTVLGGTGDDLIIGADNADSIDGGAGTDTLRLVSSYTPASDAHLENVENIVMVGTAATTVNLSNQAGEAFTVTMTNNGDTVTTADGNDSITGGTGRDSITADGGNDTINGGGGVDTIDLGAGNDRLVYALDVDASGTATGNLFAANTGDDINQFTTASDQLVFTGNFALPNMTGTTANAVNAINAIATPRTINLDGAGTGTGTGMDVVQLITTTATTVAQLLDFSVFAAGLSTTNEQAGDERIFIFNSTAAGDAAAIYKFTGDGSNGVTAAELTLIGVVDEVLAAGDIAIV